MRGQAMFAGIVGGAGMLVGVAAPAWAQGGEETPERRRFDPGQPEEQMRPQWETMVERDEAGNIKPLSEQVEVAAFRRNPLVDKSEWPVAHPEMVAWFQKLDRAVIVNCDIVKLFDEGFLDTIDPEDRTKMTQTGEMLKPLQAVTRLSEHLEKAGVLDSEQKIMNIRIADEYTNSFLQKMQEEAQLAGEQDPRAMSRRSTQHYYRSAARDGVASYRRQLLAAGSNIDKVLPALALPPAAQSKVTPAIEEYRKAGDDEARLAAMRKVAHALNYKQLRTLLEQTAAATPVYDPAPDMATAK